MNLLLFFTGALVLLKLTGVLEIGWAWVLCPIWIPILIIAVASAATFIIWAVLAQFMWTL